METEGEELNAGYSLKNDLMQMKGCLLCGKGFRRYKDYEDGQEVKGFKGFKVGICDDCGFGMVPNNIDTNSLKEFYEKDEARRSAIPLQKNIKGELSSRLSGRSYAQMSLASSNKAQQKVY